MYVDFFYLYIVYVAHVSGRIHQHLLRRVLYSIVFFFFFFFFGFLIFRFSCIVNFHNQTVQNSFGHGMVFWKTTKYKFDCYNICPSLHLIFLASLFHFSFQQQILAQVVLILYTKEKVVGFVNGEMKKNSPINSFFFHTQHT